MTRKIAVFDTTLRDGEQSPGASMNTEEKLLVAQELLRLKVDVIEAGFPISSPGDFISVQEIGKLAGDDAVVCGLTRAVEKDIDSAAEALKCARRPRIHTGLGVSPSHLHDKLRITEDQAVERAVHAVRYAKKYVDDVEFYCEDAGRAEQKFLERIVQAVVEAGATVINIPDTTGYSLPEHFGARIHGLMENVRGIENVTVACHTITPAQIRSLAELLSSDAISSNQGREVFALMAESGDDPAHIVDERGMRQVSDTSALEPVVDEVIANCPDQVAQYKGGNTKVVGYLVGQCMKASKGKGNPKLFNQLLCAKLAD